MLLLVALALTTVLQSGPTSGCIPTDLPKVEDRVTWEKYLTATFHTCFDHLGPEVAKVDVVVRSQLFVATLDCPDSKLGCVVAVSDDLPLEIWTKGEVAFMLGHEAVHLLLLHSDYSMMGTLEKEFAADSLSADSVYQGGCYGAQVIQRLGSLGDKFPKVPEEVAVRDMFYRRVALLAKCGLDVVRIKRK